MENEEIVKKAKTLIETIGEDLSKMSGALRDDLFYLHNMLCVPKEYGKGCFNCVKRTFNRLKEYCKNYNP